MPIGANEPEWRALRDLEGRFTPELQRRIEAALQTLRDSPFLPQVTGYLERGDIEGAIRALPWQYLGIDLDQSLRPMLLLLQHAGVTSLGPSGTDELRPALSDLAQSFSLRNPEAVRTAALQAADLVTAITDETRAAIRAVVLRGQQEGVTVRDQARDIRQLVGLNERQAVAVQNYRLGLEEQGVSESRIEELVARRTAKGIRYRAEMIARTETLRASNAGQRALWQQAVENGTLERSTKMVWVASADACPECQALDGRAVPVGSEFVGSVTMGDPGEAPIVTDTVDGPPQHPNCRCSLALEVEAA